jgi:hypothetical protein
MTNPTPPVPDPHHSEANWARPVGRLSASKVPAGATTINVQGRQVVSPMQGFGPLWQKTYRVRLPGLQITPQEVMKVWKENFPNLQPPMNRFYPAMKGIKPGEILYIDAMLPAWPGSRFGFPVSAGVMVLYADDEMFTIMTPAGFPEAGWNTFSAYDDDGVTVAQVQSLARTNDPIYEFGFRFIGGAKQQEKIWASVLSNLAAHLGVRGHIQTDLSCLDDQLLWSSAKNIWHNAIIRTVLYKLTAPMRWLRRPPRR